eukprot:RCo030291
MDMPSDQRWPVAKGQGCDARRQAHSSKTEHIRGPPIQLPDSESPLHNRVAHTKYLTGIMLLPPKRGGKETRHPVLSFSRDSNTWMTLALLVSDYSADRRRPCVELNYSQKNVPVVQWKKSYTALHSP